jgi:hypothetical protein
VSRELPGMTDCNAAVDGKLREPVATGRQFRFARPERAFRSALVLAGIVLLVVTACLYEIDPPNQRLAHFFYSDDTPVLIGQALLLIALGLVPLPCLTLPRWAHRHPAAFGAPLGAFALVVAFAGTTFLFHNFAVVRDELDANFDATIFRSGHLLMPLAAEWRAFVASFREPWFVLPVPGNVAWASPYLPVHAALRALAGATIGAQWTNPILLGISLAAIVAAARRIWPDRPGAAVVAGLLLATSSQAVVMAMTSYAMPAHLALNLLWLWLFLRNDRASQAAAILVGFLACGLHQVIFHPLFVAPFIAGLFLRGHYRLFALYAFAYAAIALFWIDYPALAQRIEHIPPATGSGAGAAFFVEKIRHLIENIDPSALLLQTGNLMRFLAWQNSIALPLILLSAAALRHDEGRSRELAAGIVLTIVACTILLPQQGSGWGYRYLHGFLGSWCLLAVGGWRALIQRSSADERGAAMSALTLAILANAALALPFQTAQALAAIDPYRRAMAHIEHAGTDVVLVDRTHLTHGNGLIRNEPDLGNRPIVLDLLFIDFADLKTLCGHYSVSLLTEQRALDFGIPYFALPESFEHERQKKLAEWRSLSCGRELD